ncbi:MAG: hypothetical protein SF053_21555 [Bacteroidia bacterium]|nr:hypothetical protein [Bacteroidia bacterium]
MMPTAGLCTLILSCFAMLSKPQDSPITSTNFYTAYSDLKIIQYAEAHPKLDKRLAKVLMNPKTSIGLKAAIVNAMSWHIDGKSNASLYGSYLREKYGITKLEPSADLSAADNLVMGYFTVMDDYFHPEKALPWLEKAVELAPRSHTAHLILALARAQKAMDDNWCEVWKLYAAVDIRTDLTRELRADAVAVVEEYMVLYKEDCK